ncbi:Predicted thiol-disulfide oxidoreductase YuxK, DCC family [Tenacibaculum sp. 190524A02b]|uniref:Predicted thiol-disulfide oxidoreductase YuxK, DCC family n=1 Tax=Tenacibaculum vairaonense TaxID=3137860 RepID=A0ABM9PH28_9FLAO
MKTILFDGVCNLCNNTVTFVIKRDVNNAFKFASLQSDFAQEKLKGTGINDLSTIVLIDNDVIYTKSTAILKIAKELKGYEWTHVFLWIPKFIRDFCYKLIANNRYAFFGKQDSCMLPSKELLEKFVQ